MKTLVKVAMLIALITVGGVSLGGCERIDTGNAGIEKSWSGTVSKTVLGPGMYSTILKDIYEVSGKEDTISFDNLHPKSKDNLTMEDVDIDITIQLDTSKAAEIYTRFSNDLHLHKDIGVYVVGTNYVTRQARAVIYRVAAKHDAQTMHQIRQQLESEIAVDLQKELDHDMGTNWIVIKNVNIRNLVTDRNVEESIRKITTANFLTQEKIAGQRAALEEAKRLNIETTGIAEAAAARMQIEAEAKAKANRTIAESLTPQVLESMRIEAMKEFAGKGNSTVLLPSNNVIPMVNVK